MELSDAFASLGISLGLGLLVGLQREQVSTPLAGLRTFALITILGTICAMLAQSFGGWVVAGGFLGLTGALLMGHLPELQGGQSETGVTTEIAALAMFALGAYTVVGHREVAIAMGGLIAVLLHYKSVLHGVAARLGEDSRAIMQFVLLSLVILPALPDRAYGPYAVLNPRKVWLIVVLIVGIGLAGYIAYKFLGQAAGLLLAGALGGIISSTAVTVGYTKMAKNGKLAPKAAALVILIATSVSAALLVVEVAIIAPGFLRSMLLPLSAVPLVLALSSLPLWFSRDGDGQRMPAQGNPTELRHAFLFALLYSMILLGIAFGKDHYGSGALYAIAAISGIADLQAIALSTAQLVEGGSLLAVDGLRVIQVAFVTSLGFKFAVVLIGGSRGLLRWLALPLLLSIGTAIGLFVWY